MIKVHDIVRFKPEVAAHKIEIARGDWLFGARPDMQPDDTFEVISVNNQGTEDDPDLELALDGYPWLVYDDEVDKVKATSNRFAAPYEPEALYKGQHLAVYAEDEGIEVRDRSIRVGDMSQPFDWVASFKTLEAAKEYITFKESLETKDGLYILVGKGTADRDLDSLVESGLVASYTEDNESTPWLVEAANSYYFTASRYTEAEFNLRYDIIGRVLMS